MLEYILQQSFCITLPSLVTKWTQSYECSNYALMPGSHPSCPTKQLEYFEHLLEHMLRFHSHITYIVFEHATIQFKSKSDLFSYFYVPYSSKKKNCDFLPRKLIFGNLIHTQLIINKNKMIIFQQPIYL